MTLGGRSDGWVGGLMDVFFTIFLYHRCFGKWGSLSPA